MLYPYKYPRVKIQNLQSFVNYIMLEVVLRARRIPDTVFTESLVIPKYKPLISDINPNYILGPIKRMYSISKGLDSSHLKLLRKAVYENNKIEELCMGRYTPIRYKDLNRIFSTVQETEMLIAIKAFCKNLYEKCLTLAPIYTRYGKIKDYHDILVQDDDTCHACGTTSMLTKFTSVRNAFDHYLAKQTYPFVSINFKNLVPACYVCNSSYKKTKDVLVFNGKRKKAFYPFTQEDYKITFQFSFKPTCVYSDRIKPEDFELKCTCIGHQEEAENWMRIYNIKEQYKAKCCNKTFKKFLSGIIDECRIKGCSVDECLSFLEKNLDVDMNFLKVPFYRAALATLDLT